MGRRRENMKKISITLGIFGLVSGLFGVLGNTASYATQPPDFSAVVVAPPGSPGGAAAIAVSRKSKIVVGRGTLQIGANLPFILNVTGAILSTDKVKNVKGQEPIPITNSAFPGLISCSPASAQLTAEVFSPGVATPGVATIQLNECEPGNPSLFGNTNPCTGSEVTDTTAFQGVCLNGCPGKDTIVITNLIISGNQLCSDNSPCLVCDDVTISEPELPVCTTDFAFATGDVTCF
jgi:hypothetical protein